MPSDVFQQVMSIGPACRAKHQIQRVFGKRAAPRGVFDWQTTSTAAFVEYLRSDFQGMFERSDLSVKDGIVFNLRFDTGHYHEFPPDMTVPQIDVLYAQARKSHDLCCLVTRKALSNRLSTLLVLSGPVIAEVESALGDYIGRKSQRKLFKILAAPDDPGPGWQGTDTIWDGHLGRYELRPPLRTVAGYQFHRMKKNLRYVLPKSFR